MLFRACVRCDTQAMNACHTVLGSRLWAGGQPGIAGLAAAPFGKQANMEHNANETHAAVDALCCCCGVPCSCRCCCNASKTRCETSTSSVVKALPLCLLLLLLLLHCFAVLMRARKWGDVPHGVDTPLAQRQLAASAAVAMRTYATCGANTPLCALAG